MLGGLFAVPAGAVVIHVEVGEDQPAEGPGVALLLTSPNLPGTKPNVQYRDLTGAANNLTLVTNTGPYAYGYEVTDPGILIVGVQPDSATPNCSTGYGQAACTSAYTFAIDTGASDDTVRVQGGPASVFINAGDGDDVVDLSGWYPSADCGNGYDEAIVKVGDPVSNLRNCEVVTFV